jgi:hypothetical protein
MTIKLSDYILEQSISQSEIADIAMEQAIAEIEVSMALCEAYFKQQSMGIVQEFDMEKSHPIIKFLTSIVNACFRAIMKFSGWVSEKRMNKLIKRLENMSNEEKEKFKIALPSKHLGFYYFQIVDSLDGINYWFDKLYDSKVCENDEMFEFEDDIRQIKEGRDLFNSKLEDTTELYEYNYDEFKSYITQVRDAIVKKKNEFKKLQREFKFKTAKDQYENLKNLDDKTAKKIFNRMKKCLKRSYVETTYIMTEMIKFVQDAEKATQKHSEEGISHKRGDVRPPKDDEFFDDSGFFDDDE